MRLSQTPVACNCRRNHRKFSKWGGGCRGGLSHILESSLKVTLPFRRKSSPAGTSVGLMRDPPPPGSGPLSHQAPKMCRYIFTYGGDKDVPSCRPCNPQTGESHHKSHFILWTNKCWSKIFQGRLLNTCIAAVV